MYRYHFFFLENGITAPTHTRKTSAAQLCAAGSGSRRMPEDVGGGRASRAPHLSAAESHLATLEAKLAETREQIRFHRERAAPPLPSPPARAPCVDSAEPTPTVPSPAHLSREQLAQLVTDLAATQHAAEVKHQREVAELRAEWGAQTEELQCAADAVAESALQEAAARQRYDEALRREAADAAARLGESSRRARAQEADAAAAAAASAAVRSAAAEADFGAAAGVRQRAAELEEALLSERREGRRVKAEAEEMKSRLESAEVSEAINIYIYTHAHTHARSTHTHTHTHTHVGRKLEEVTARVRPRPGA